MASHNIKNTAEKPLTSVMEDYLEAIYDLDKEKRVVRVKDIAKRMDVKMPTVSSMLKTLNGRGLVYYEKYEYVELTKEGAAVGKEMRRRHEVLFKFLTEILKIEFKTADEEACKMEHTLSSATLDSFTDFMEFIQTCPRAGESWLQYFEEYRTHGRRPEKCQARSETFSCEFKDQVDSIKVPNS
ncbi:MAG: metal-dependent transcriptional regulator [Desulfosarcina sp.]|nr:metal-dependent transcriptional regulator [Desulfosarcina sp.]MBC2744452.1 metal-dependent transcriptional regulator [Desulfosarcina sp.]MBC2767360.1 metal-dependent transcriptional regulator [Desulfosarcina sp.]